MSTLDAAELDQLTGLYCGKVAEGWAYLRERAEVQLTDVCVMQEAAEEARREALDQRSDLVPLEERHAEFGPGEVRLDEVRTAD